MSQLFTLIVAPSDLGGVPGPRRGAGKLARALLASLTGRIKTVVNIESTLPAGYLLKGGLGGKEVPRYRTKVATVIGEVKKAVLLAYKNGTMPLVVGGDHSISIGSLAASLEWWSGSCGVLWADQHPDLHTPDTSFTKHAHGMPLRSVLGEGDELFIRNVSHLLDPELLIHFGAGSIEKGEFEHIDLLRKKGAFFANFVHRNNPHLLAELQRRIRVVAAHGMPWVLEFDIDVLRLRGVPKSCYDPYGMRTEMLRQIFGWATTYLNIVAIDVVEYSPANDEDRTCEQIVDILGGVVGKMRFPSGVFQNA